MQKPFDSKKYIATQTSEILKRLSKFSHLYLEIGGKLCYDEHATRVLPGYKKTTKIDILKQLGPLEIIYCINTQDIITNREVGLSGQTYKEKILTDLHDIESFGFLNIKIVFTRLQKKKPTDFIKKLKKYKVYFQKEIENYEKGPTEILKGYEKNPYIKTRENIIIVTGPAGGSGKMNVALSQIYFERKRGIKTGYAKFESFPVWNLPLSHPINIAYEAGTADLGDYNMIDKYHKKAYGIKAVNYNRDVENFDVLLEIARKVSGEKWPFGYKSPTDMGVNMIKAGIVDDKACRRAGVREVKRRAKRAFRINSKSLESKRLRKILKKI